MDWREVSKLWQISHFWVKNPFNSYITIKGVADILDTLLILNYSTTQIKALRFTFKMTPLQILPHTNNVIKQL